MDPLPINMAFQNSSHARSSNPSANLRYWKSIPSDSYFSVASQSNSMVQQQISLQHGYNFSSVENGNTNYPSTSGSYESNNALTAQDFFLLRKRKRLESNTPPNKATARNTQSNKISNGGNFRCDVCGFLASKAAKLKKHRKRHGIEARHSQNVSSSQPDLRANNGHGFSSSFWRPPAVPTSEPTLSSTTMPKSRMPEQESKSSILFDIPFEARNEDFDRNQRHRDVPNRSLNEKQIIPVKEQKVSSDRMNQTYQLVKEIKERFRQLDAVRQESSLRVDILQKNVEEMEEEERVSRSRTENLTVQRDVIRQKLGAATRAKVEADIQLKTIQCQLLEFQIDAENTHIARNVYIYHDQQKSQVEEKLRTAMNEIELFHWQEQSLLQQLDREKETWVNDYQLLASARLELNKQMEELKMVSEPQRRLLIERNKFEEQMI